MAHNLTPDRMATLAKLSSRFQHICGTPLGDLIWVYAESESSKGKEYGCYLIGRMTGMHNNLFEGESRLLEDHWEFAEHLFLPFVQWSVTERVTFLEGWVSGLSDNFPAQVKQEYREAIERLKVNVH